MSKNGNDADEMAPDPLVRELAHALAPHLARALCGPLTEAIAVGVCAALGRTPADEKKENEQ